MRSGKSLKHSVALLLKLPTRQTSQAQVQSLAQFHYGVADLRNLYREKLMELASKMVDRSNLHKELEIADVTESEDGFTVKFRFRA